MYVTIPAKICQLLCKGYVIYAPDIGSKFCTVKLPVDNSKQYLAPKEVWVTLTGIIYKRESKKKDRFNHAKLEQIKLPDQEQQMVILHKNNTSLDKYVVTPQSVYSSILANLKNSGF